MKNIIFGIIAGVLVATAVGAYQGEEHKRGSPMGMMGEQKPGEQSQDMMQGMKEMMARMTKMMDRCSQMMGSKSEPKKDESSK
jgi:hypothetical protein